LHQDADTKDSPGGKTYQHLRGEFHRHTDISGDEPPGVGTMAIP
jgi:hypothetical protein